MKQQKCGGGHRALGGSQRSACPGSQPERRAQAASQGAGALLAALPTAIRGPFSGWGSLGTGVPFPCSHVSLLVAG